jgi:hypothetical protein
MPEIISQKIRTEKLKKSLSTQRSTEKNVISYVAGALD